MAVDLVRPCFLWLLTLFTSVSFSTAQDLFLVDAPTENLGRFQVSVAQNDIEKVSLGEGGIDGDVFTISPSSQPHLCLDYVQGHGSNHLQVWECNGHENQLFFFEPNSYTIKWGGAHDMCVDAGATMTAGTWLALYPCKGYPQQKWGYDATTETIFLASSRVDANLCMDIVGGDVALGTAVEIWECDNKLQNQKWSLSHGITIRPLAGLEFCLDLAGGPQHQPTNGDKVEIWRCSGLSNQKWLFDKSVIRPVNDHHKCIDAGKGMKGSLIIWDCNSSPQQHFGYDNGNAKTIYLAASADASLCMDITGGAMSEGTGIQTWACTSCWNQQWQAIGPAHGPELKMMPSAHASSGFLAPRADGPLQSCPERQHDPVPAPGPPARVEGHCETGSNYGFPVFYKYSDLNSSPWGAYYHMVYGEVPTTGYPICPYMLFLLYKPLLGQAGVQLPQAVDTQCPTQAGTPFAKMSGFPSTDWAWIYGPNLGRPVGDYVPKDYWVEVMHTAFSMDGSATWFYYTPGSGVYAWTGTTFAYDDHPNAVQDLLGAPCSDPKGQIGNNECQNNFEDMYKAAKNKGADTLQFKKHSDMQCDVNNNNDQRNMAIEIVDLGGPGMTTCSGPSGKTRFRAGWQAKYECVCANANSAINCEGFALSR